MTPAKMPAQFKYDLCIGIFRLFTPLNISFQVPSTWRPVLEDGEFLKLIFTLLSSLQGQSASMVLVLTLGLFLVMLD
jgi:hypothetical protein